MKTEYYIINPTGNITALVTTPTEKADYKRFCNEIMREHPQVEQVGFADFSEDVFHLNMSGGEFCANATLSAIGLYSYLTQETGNFNIKASGVPKILSVSSEKNKGGFICECSLPFPKELKSVKLENGNNTFVFPFVEIGGISHIIAPFDFSKEKAEGLIKEYAEKNNIPALGFMFYERDTGKLIPLVYVTEIGTLFYENSCASGSCAVGAYRAFLSGSEEALELIQPGGTINITANIKEGYIRLSNKIIIENSYTREM